MNKIEFVLLQNTLNEVSNTLIDKITPIIKRYVTDEEKVDLSKYNVNINYTDNTYMGTITTLTISNDVDGDIDLSGIYVTVQQSYGKELGYFRIDMLTSNELLAVAEAIEELQGKYLG